MSFPHFTSPRPFRTIAVLALSAVASCGDPTGPASDGDAIVFLSTREGVMRGAEALENVFRMNPDGSGVENLTRTPGSYNYLAVTQDRRTVIFEGTLSFDAWTGSDCPTQVWRIGVDGSGLRKVTTDGCSTMPRLSPDGARVAYLRGSEIRVINIDGTGARTVSQDLPPVQPNACGEVPRTTLRTIGWVSSTRILFERHVCLEGSTYYTVDNAGNGLTVEDYPGHSAYVSPDGSRLAYGIAGNVVVANADGTNPRTIATGAELPTRLNTGSTIWSPDGRQIFYYSESFTGLYVVGHDGTGARRLVLPSPDIRLAFNAWSRDGRRIAWTQPGEGRSDVVVTNADGTGLVNLTAGSSGYNSQAVWVRR